MPCRVVSRAWSAVAVRRRIEGSARRTACWAGTGTSFYISNCASGRALSLSQEDKSIGPRNRIWENGFSRQGKKDRCAGDRGRRPRQPQAQAQAEPHS